MEPVGLSWKAVAVLASGYGGAAGACALPLLAWLLPGWRALTLVISALVALVICTVVPSMPESPRWFINSSRKVLITPHIILEINK